MEGRVCNRCKLWKPYSEFYRHKLGKDGYRSQCKPCENSVSLEWAQRNPDKKHFWDKRYRIRQQENSALEKYVDLLEEQNGLCAICKQTETAKHPNGKPLSLAWDHDHVSGQYRGLLCGIHNRMLGLSGDNIEILEEAIKYLIKWSNCGTRTHKASE
jgi:hypothetical protein